MNGFWRAAAVLAPLIIGGCDDGVHAPTERDVFNVYFYYPNNGKELYLGKVTGISACQSTAGSHAAQQKMSRDAGWSYICCREANGSSCASKHR